MLAGRLSRLFGARVRGRALATTMAFACLGAVALAAAPAALGSKLKEEFALFVDCPTATAGVCTVAKTSSGEFVMGTKTVPINQTITLQGGLAFSSLQTQPLIAARDGNTLSKTPLTIPGGLLGVANIGGEVTATAELAGTASDILINQYFLAEGRETAVVLPLKIKLDNPLLGENCYIGSNESPVLLHLTDGTTNPPFPGTPISGNKGTIGNSARGKITVISNNTLVDNSFPVPAATNCGSNPLLAPVVTLLVNLDAGLPSGAGRNKAVMTGFFEQTLSVYAAKFAPPPKEKKKK
jgi:hypothetical protein